MSKGQYTCTQCKEDFHDHCTNLACIIGYHCCKSTMQSEEELGGVEDPLEKRWDEAYALGKVAALEGVTSALMKLASDKFCAGRDGEANAMRDLAYGFKEEAKTRRAEIQKMREEG